MENECAKFPKYSTSSFEVIEFGRCPIINPLRATVRHLFHWSATPIFSPNLAQASVYAIKRRGPNLNSIPQLVLEFI